MADADWVLYRQVRGRPLPERAEMLEQNWVLETTLKRDFYAATGVYRPADATSTGVRLLLKIYHTDALAKVIPLRSLGRLLCWREALYLRRLAHVDGVPRYWGRFGESGLIREFLPGRNLREHLRVAGRPDSSFFPKLSAILDAVHARGVAHNDLSKPENILVSPDGSPVLIDFQIALILPWRDRPIAGFLSRVILRYFQRVDRHHLSKLHRRHRPGDFSASEIAELKRGAGFWLGVHGRLRRPYRALRHFVLDRFLLADPNQRPLRGPHRKPGSPTQRTRASG